MKVGMHRSLIFLILVAAELPAFAAAEFGLETVVTYQEPERLLTNGQGHVFADFGKDAFGWLEILPPEGVSDAMIALGVSEEASAYDECIFWNGGTIRSYWYPAVKVPNGIKVWRPPLGRNDRNTKKEGKTPAVQLPAKYGTVYPFRYVEIHSVPFAVTRANIRRAMVHYPLNMKDSSFSCSDERLVKVYDFCKYTILATSFAGLYVDGDRERVPYEADAYINQLGQYAVADDLLLPRATFEYLMRHPTWPTEWAQNMIMMAWADWKYTGSTNLIAKYYRQLKDEKLLLQRVGEESFINSRIPVDVRSADDLIDWPPADRCGYVFSKTSAVINAFYYRNLLEMRDIAEVLGFGDDAREFAAKAEELKRKYNERFFDAERGLYRDGIGVGHCGFHANVLAVAFGLAPIELRGKIADWLIGQGMPCSVYFAQYYLEALFAAGKDRAAIALMTSDSDRSWLGMMRQGATMTMEAWNLNDKPNLDWNHAWGTPPLNLIARCVLGVTPLEAGYAKVRIAPQVGSLKKLLGTIPTVRGVIRIEVDGDTLSYSSPVPAEVVWQGKVKKLN